MSRHDDLGRGSAPTGREPIEAKPAYGMRLGLAIFGLLVGLAGVGLAVVGLASGSGSDSGRVVLLVAGAVIVVVAGLNILVVRRRLRARHGRDQH